MVYFVVTCRGICRIIFKDGVLGWVSRTDESLYAEAFQALVKRWYKCIDVAGEYVEKLMQIPLTEICSFIL